MAHCTLFALTLLFTLTHTERSLNSHADLVEGGLRHTRHPSALRVHHDVGHDVVQVDDHASRVGEKSVIEYVILAGFHFSLY